MEQKHKRTCYICNEITEQYTRNIYKDKKRVFCYKKDCRNILREHNKEIGSYRSGNITREFNIDDIKNKVDDKVFKNVNVDNKVNNDIDLKKIIGKKNKTFKFTINGLEKTAINEFKKICKRYNISQSGLFNLFVNIGLEF